MTNGLFRGSGRSSAFGQVATEFEALSTKVDELEAEVKNSSGKKPQIQEAVFDLTTVDFSKLTDKQVEALKARLGLVEKK